MNGVGRCLHRFFFAEEVPRAYGLAFVVIHVVTLGALLYVGDGDVTRRETQRAKEMGLSAVNALAGALSTTPTPPEEWLPVLQRFARSQSVSELRVYDRNRQIVASLIPTETGRELPAGDERLFPVNATLEQIDEGAFGRAHRIRAPIALGATASEHFLDVVISPPEAAHVPLWRAVWPVAAGSLVALLIVYHMLRKHFRSVTRIASRLVNHSEALQEQLQELRVADARDEVGACWNRLIDWVQDLEEEIQRSTASEELLAALSKTNAGELADAMTAVPIGVLLLSDAGAVSYANTMAVRIIGWSKPISEGVTIHDEVAAEGRPLVEAITAAITQPEARRATHRQVEAGDGSFYHVEVVPARTGHQTRGYVVLLLDVSQQVRADKAREEFVSQVTHELRTPLTNIRAYAETLSSGMFDDPKVITECYNVITKETRRLGRLVEDILSISQLEVGTMQLVFDDVDLRPLLSEAVRDVRGLAESKKQDLQLILPPKLPTFRGDRDKLAVVFNNLLGNALKYTPAGGQITVSCKATEDAVQISFRDTGIGIDPKDHGRIFEKFVRVADDELVQKEAGTGIGLTTAREIVQQHGGQITVMSRKGEGSTFTVSLPVEKRAAVPV